MFTFYPCWSPPKSKSARPGRSSQAHERFISRWHRTLLLLVMLACQFTALAQSDGPVCTDFTTRDRTNADFGNNNLNRVAAQGNLVAIATDNGLSVSTDGGRSFSNKTPTNGLADAQVFAVAIASNTLYAGTYGGLSVSTDGGKSFTTPLAARTNGISVMGNTIYAATLFGLARSIDGGKSFDFFAPFGGRDQFYSNATSIYSDGNRIYMVTDRARDHGLLVVDVNSGATYFSRFPTDFFGRSQINGVYAQGSLVYVATKLGLYVSNAGGLNADSFSLRDRTNADFGSNNIQAVYGVGKTLYVATDNGLSVSTDGGIVFSQLDKFNRTVVNGVAVSGNRLFVVFNGGLAYCPPLTPIVGAEPFDITAVTGVSCQTVTQTERRLTFTPQYSGATAAPISFSVVNEMLPTTQPGPYTLRLYIDNPAITLSAQQGERVATFRYNWLAACSSSARLGAPEPGTVLEVNILGNPIQDNQVVVEVKGAEGQPVQYELLNNRGQRIGAQTVSQAAGCLPSGRRCRWVSSRRGCYCCG